MTRRRVIITTVLALSGLIGGAQFFNSSFLVAAEELPKQLSDDAFWSLVAEFSEEGGSFPSQNFVSNELTFQYVIPSLTEKTKTGGVYLGVGPEQNFTYIVATRPKIAFIFDIRRQNMLQHLMYKALIEISTDRADFLSRLFSRERPADVGPGSSVQELFRAYDVVENNSDLFLNTMDAIKKQLIEKHGFPLTPSDESRIRFVFSAFYFGPNLTYRGPTTVRLVGSRQMPTFAELMMQTDEAGEARSYLASEENFRILQDLERNNLVVPLVGDFAGEKAIRRVGQYLKEHDATVTAFYLSNVEQYLFEQGDNWSKFYRNVETLPLDSTSTFIRSWFNWLGVSVANNSAWPVSLLCSMQDLLTAFHSGNVSTYRDVIGMSN